MLPKRDKNDPLYNRRALTWLSFYYNILWSLLVLVMDVNSDNLDAEKVIAYLAVPAGIFAVFSIGYVKAAREDDKNNGQP